MYAPSKHTAFEERFLYPVSKDFINKTLKFIPKRDEAFIMLPEKAPKTFVIENMYNPNELQAKFHTSAFKLFNNFDIVPVAPIRKSGKPPKKGTGS